ncbi:Zn-ribbon domain-containing OB-fold protein [Salinisphaera aquimarina]|uniref:Zn-ribbon domain-containing OB-fold protein n=1 Tax=Salinisphaera aquimarina TaxID=2094031 RepID=A0ABV7EPK1_9GAMM
MSNETQQVSRPIPIPDPTTVRFWKAASEGRLELPHCDACDKLHYYPRAICPYCGSEDLSWRQLSGRGAVHSWTISRRPAGAGFADLAPYAVALIDLEEGPRMLSNVRTDDLDALTIGQAVSVDFEALADDIALPVFTPV